ncbi:hypothetical protein OHC33_010245 [Knufia fluminis]|uniref:Sodium/calcium exchanger membrane region domain-containing protein n=1 Tax=Knufia fluminis TaxID=191047 RepID=A0AAN8ENF3_9EURO|nr:hypothetical protein OHC33_010245 [Knufia fluminis]
MATAYRRGRPVKPPELIFLSTIAIVSLLALYSFGKSYTRYETGKEQVLALRALEEPDQECRLVHNVHGASDQCAFILRNCPDEEAGLISYLQLYYCSLSHLKPIAFAIIVIWSALLFSTIGVAASDFLCVNLSTIAAVLGMSESLTGVTFLAFGNGSPDVFSTFAAMKSNSGSLAVGELMGAAGFITAVVSGSMAITKPFNVGRKSFVRDVAFFAVAASFSLVFLRDGRLHLWECIAMVAFYIFYVIFVVVWHWYMQRQRRKHLAEIAARLHHHIPEQQELEVPQIDLDEESAPAGERSPLLRSGSGASVPTLLTPGTPAWMNQGDDDDDEARDRALAELQSNMRVRGLHGRSRRSTITPIRPSLLGAIEFRSVLNALEKRSTSSGNVIGLRRYSDDGLHDDTPTTNFSISQPHLALTAPDDTRASMTGRNRAVSANDAAGLHIDSDLLSPSRGTPDTAIYTPNGRRGSSTSHRRYQSDMPATDYLAPAYSNNVLLSPSSMSTSSGAPSPRLNYFEHNGMLAPPSTANTTFQNQQYADVEDDNQGSPMLSPGVDVPKLHLPDPGHRKSPLMHQWTSPDGTPTSSRPPSIRLPAPSMSPESGPDMTLLGDDEDYPQEMKRFSWWPYEYLEAPQVILSTLFPGLSDWGDKGFIGRLSAIATAPSIFLLTITLPVVDPTGDQTIEEQVHTAAATPGRSRSQTLTQPTSESISAQPLDQQVNGAGPHPHSAALSRRNTGYDKNQDVEEPLTNQKEWNRWLVIVQLFTAPMFMVVITWANIDEGHSTKELLLMMLGCLVFSLAGTFLLLLTTSPNREPKYRPIFCFLGFMVAIAWISTIANEVVGVLKAIGVILNMSDAILGLTIFAVGNSLGDLVADITIARMGYPKMALSACFGGPMLNILLGIGLGGAYMTIHNGQHKHHKHPNRPIQYKPYTLEVSTTLIVSGIALLVTLTGLLIFVPLNGWRMDRKIGIGLIILWVIATTGNVIVEVLGLGTEGPISS